jgi:hypothetical protein
MARTAFLTLWFLAAIAPLAVANDGGEGWLGETDDKMVTDAGFIVIAGVPLLVCLLSLLMASLDRRKYRRQAAAKARVARADERGGW